LSLLDSGSGLLLLLLRINQAWYDEDCGGGEAEDPIHAQSISCRPPTRRHDEETSTLLKFRE
jgi:hypothetical protein